MSKTKNRITNTLSSSFLNKYTIAIIAFVIWISFFDRYNLITQYKLSRSVKELTLEKTDYEAELEKAIADRKAINSDIEKYAREKYLFHKDNEQVILIK
jgi:cell division protein FtsB